VGGDAQGLERVLGIELGDCGGEELPEAIDIEMGIEAITQDGVGRLADGDFGARFEIDHREFRVGLADIDDADEPFTAHARLPLSMP